MRRSKQELIGIMLRTLEKHGPMDTEGLSEALGICIRNTRKYVVEAQKAKLIYIKAWSRPDGAYGHKRAIWALGNAPSAPYPKDDPKVRRERKEAHKRIRVVVPTINMELAQVMMAWS